MNHFKYSIPTEAFFGKGSIDIIPTEIKKYGQRVLFLYGGSSIKKIGLYDKIQRNFEDNAIYHMELSGVEANPKLSKVMEGIALIKENQLDFILAVGGGSVIDCGKAISAGVFYEGDPWDFCIGKAIVEKTLPVGAVVTIAATGSEMNGNAIITNEKLKRKLPAKSPLMKPRFAVLDPTLTYSVSKYQTAAGVADIISHVMEQYFSRTEGTFLQDRLCEAVIKTCIKYGPIALKDPENYEARANLMWASTLGLNESLGYGKVGDWAVHSIEHEISAEYDITHGVGLAILIPSWMRWVLDASTVDKLYEYAVNVWQVDKADKFEGALQGIEKTEVFFQSLGLPKSLSELGIGDGHFEKMAVNALNFRQVGNFKKLSKEDIVSILQDAHNGCASVPINMDRE